MCLSPKFPVVDVENFASYLGLEGTDADMFYESYYQINTDDEHEEDTYVYE